MIDLTWTVHVVDLTEINPGKPRIRPVMLLVNLAHFYEEQMAILFGVDLLCGIQQQTLSYQVFFKGPALPVILSYYKKKECHRTTDYLTTHYAAKHSFHFGNALPCHPNISVCAATTTVCVL